MGLVSTNVRTYQLSTGNANSATTVSVGVVILVEPLLQYIWGGFISPVTRVERYHLSDILDKICQYS